MTTTFPTRNCEHLKAGDVVAVSGAKARKAE